MDAPETATAEPTPALFAVVGHPVLHSRSPQLYNATFREAGIDANYTRLAAESAAEALTIARQIGMAGLNVTAPFKADVLPLLDDADEVARSLGVVNTVVLRDGVAWGTDTDPDGVHAMLRETGVEVRGKRVVLLGAGGAARGAAHALAAAGAAEITFVNRSEGRGRETAEALGGRFAPWKNAAAEIAHTELLLSCVPPEVDHVRVAWLEPGLPILDACYVRSALASRVLAAGGRYLGGGLAWLLGQARASYRHFTGEDPPAEAMTRSLIDATVRRRPTHVALCGMMGTGKSAAGAPLAEALGRPLVDVDAQVEAGTGATVAQLFARNGEVVFRAREALAIRAALEGDPAVIALGGGALIDPQMRGQVGARALTVWLWADAETCVARAGLADRPLLGAEGAVEDARRRIGERLPGYARAAHFLIGTTALEPAGVAARIAGEIARVWPD